MAAIIVFDSVFGNTAEVARAVGEELAGAREVRLIPVNDARETDIHPTDLLVLGSPTRGFRPTPAMQEFLGAMPRDKLSGIAAAVFDTRLDADRLRSVPLGQVMRMGGYAADVLTSRLAEKGARTTGETGGFFIERASGPLRPGEIERARAWARRVGATVDTGEA